MDRDREKRHKRELSYRFDEEERNITLASACFLKANEFPTRFCSKALQQ